MGTNNIHNQDYSLIKEHLCVQSDFFRQKGTINIINHTLLICKLASRSFIELEDVSRFTQGADLPCVEQVWVVHQLLGLGGCSYLLEQLHGQQR